MSLEVILLFQAFSSAIIWPTVLSVVQSELKLEVVFKVQKMARYASFCLIMGPFKGKCLFLPDYGPLG